MQRSILRCISVFFAALLLTGCSQAPSSDISPASSISLPPQVELEDSAVPMTEGFTDATAILEATLDKEVSALAEGPAAVPTYLAVSASGVDVKKNGQAIIDYSNIKDGYVMVQFTGTTTKRLKAQVKGPSTTYTYDIKQQEWTTFPLTDGNGKYQVTIYENITGTRYTSVLSHSFTAKLTDEFAPYLRSNQYVNFEAAPKTIAKAAELTRDLSDPLAKVQAIYGFVVDGFTYDRQLAATVKSGYLPVLDTVLEKKSGICFDYASTMTGMLRSQGIPCKLVVGYAGTAYHAWISVWSEETGWIDGAIYFNGVSWHRMDPTFASNSKRSQSIMEYIGNGSNYSAKYFY